MSFRKSEISAQDCLPKRCPGLAWKVCRSFVALIAKFAFEGEIDKFTNFQIAIRNLWWKETTKHRVTVIVFRKAIHWKRLHCKRYVLKTTSSSVRKNDFRIHCEISGNKFTLYVVIYCETLDIYSNIRIIVVSSVISKLFVDSDKLLSLRI